MKRDERATPSKEQMWTSRTNDTTDMDRKLKYARAVRILFVISSQTTWCDAGDGRTQHIVKTSCVYYVYLFIYFVFSLTIYSTKCKLSTHQRWMYRLHIQTVNRCVSQSHIPYIFVYLCRPGYVQCFLEIMYLSVCTCTSFIVPNKKKENDGNYAQKTFSLLRVCLPWQPFHRLAASLSTSDH